MIENSIRYLRKRFECSATLRRLREGVHMYADERARVVVATKTFRNRSRAKKFRFFKSNIRSGITVATESTWRTRVGLSARCPNATYLFSRFFFRTRVRHARTRSRTAKDCVPVSGFTARTYVTRAADLFLNKRYTVNSPFQHTPMNTTRRQNRSIAAPHCV